jgi:hypothetical protein
MNDYSVHDLVGSNNVVMNTLNTSILQEGI